MSNERLYVDFHVVQTVPPSCVNRDDTGRPKTAFYGGANRARVSSQSWKHAMRLMFNELFTSEVLGYRTMHAVDAASQVAHSISTHAVQNEYDYFTAVDDCSPEDSAGAGHLGTTEFNSSTLYRYATVNVAQLKKSIGVSVAEVIKGFAEAFICSMPTGKQNSYANRTYPDMVYVTIRKDQPVNLVGAFEKPVISNNGYVEESVKKLQEYAGKVYDNFSGKPVKSFVIGADAISDAERVNLDELLEKLYSYIKDEVV